MPTHAPLRFWFRCLVVVLLLAVAGGAVAGKKRSLLEKNQYAYSAAIRWGDFEGAWSMVDPKVREDKPMTDADFSRFEQIQVTSYRDLASMSRPDGAVLREVQIEILNRNNLTQRRVRYTEVWRYDAERKNWWIEALPDFWHGR
jgi:hypothetical protein